MFMVMPEDHIYRRYRRARATHIVEPSDKQRITPSSVWPTESGLAKIVSIIPEDEEEKEEEEPRRKEDETIPQYEPQTEEKAAEYHVGS